jgi:hypothetical protein
MTAHLPNHDHDYDGRPPVGWDDYDPLLEALVRAHPELIPPQLVDRLASRPRNLLAVASD